MEEMTPDTAIKDGSARPADRALAERLLAGDEAAQEELYRSLRPRLKATAAYFLGWQDPDIEDMVQMSFQAAFEKLADYDPSRASLYTWTNQICVYLCFKRVRRRKRTVLALAGELEAMAGPSPAAEEDPQLASVRKAVATLGERCRDLVQKRFYENGSYADLARHLKVPMGTVASRLARCLESLRDRFPKEA
jgi:RNA polymerase sigma-70 factor (ECF subfamily)